MPVVQAGDEVIEFPDSMSDGDIKSALDRRYASKALDYATKSPTEALGSLSRTLTLGAEGAETGRRQDQKEKLGEQLQAERAGASVDRFGESVLGGLEKGAGALAEFDPFNLLKRTIKVPEQLLGGHQYEVAPALSPETVRKGVDLFDPLPDSPGSVREGLKQFMAETGSSFTSPDQAAALMAGNVNPELVGRLFQTQAASQIPAATQQVVDAVKSGDSTALGKSAASLAASVAIPAAIEHGLRPDKPFYPPETAPVSLDVPETPPAPVETEPAVPETKPAEPATKEPEPATIAPKSETSAPQVEPTPVTTPVTEPAKPSDVGEEQLALVGMGGAIPSEFDNANPSGADIYGIAQRVREERAKAGQTAAIEPGRGVSALEAVVHGQDLLAQDPLSAQKAVDDFKKNKAVSFSGLSSVRAKGEEAFLAARNIEGKFGTDSPEYQNALEAAINWDKASKEMQTEWHKTGQAQQGQTDIDTGSFTGLARAYSEDSGKDFTDSQAENAKRIAARVKAASDAERAAKDKLKAEIQKQQPSDPVVKSLADRIASTLDQTAAAALSRIKARRAEGRLFTGIDPEELADYAIYGAAKISKGAIEFSKWSAEMVKDLGDYITPHLKQIWEAADKHLDESVSKVAPAKVAEQVKSAVKKSQTPEQQVWAKAREQLDKGQDDFDEMRNKIAADLGMKVDEVTRALSKNQAVKRATNDAWKSQQNSRRLKEQAKRWVTAQSTPGYLRAIQAIPKVLFGLKVGFHGTVALGTHAPVVAFQPRFWNAYVRDFGKMYRMVGSPAYYERQVQDLLRRPNYIEARRAGLVNDPFVFEDYNSPDTAKYFGNLTGMGNRGYSVLKILRQDMFDQHWNQLPKDAQIPEVAQAIADGINHATGVVKGKAPKGTNLALFAPRLEGSRAMWLAGDPIRAANTFANWKNATEGEKHFAINQIKEKAWVFGTFASLMALNQGFLSATGSKQKINLTNPLESDFLKFKAAGMDVAYGSAMVNMAKLPIRLGTAIAYSGKTSKLVLEDERVYKLAGDYIRSQMSPFAGTLTDLLTGRDFQGRPLPRKGLGLLPGDKDIPKRLRMHGINKPYTWPEYSSEQFTFIPISEGIREVWGKGMGMSDEQIRRYLKAISIISVMSGTGARVTEDKNIKK